MTATVIDTFVPVESAAERAKRSEVEQHRAQQYCADLAKRFQSQFDIIDLATGEVFAGRALMTAAFDECAEQCRRAVAHDRPELVGRNENAWLVILPLGRQGLNDWIAIGEASSSDERLLTAMAEMFVESVQARRRMHDLQEESRKLSAHIGATFEEITLIYRLTQSLSISHSPQDIGAQALERLHEVIAAEGLAIYYNFAFDEELFKHGGEEQPIFIVQGNVPTTVDRFTKLSAIVGEADSLRPYIANHGIPNDDGSFDDVRQLVMVPLREGERLFGWLAAFNHKDSREFGSSEANLLASIGTILGIHSGNIDLYKQQADLFAGTVRTMSSAIDAKDPYTRGHSDRVARVSVRLAQALGCDDTTLRTLYLAGLLHDVGKIGIDDGVLRKPGKLTDGEYEHIKTHVEIGYRILRGLKKMGHLLPVVLHHHESWDGKGYPFGLAGTNIPYLARIVAVADAYDAMASDRPYRKGMEDEKLDAIFRNGAGKQWDPDVVDAFFRVREDIRQISMRNPDPIDTLAVEWRH
ncbi:MAG: HD domain-containing protein [Planctomycetia bacterium]|nr:HD domain-containing protein [Planctomycetia bacterium]